MNQTTTARNRHPVSALETLRFQLEKNGKFYCDYRKDAHEQLLHRLQNNDCREIIAAAVDGDHLANVFVQACHRIHLDILEAFLNHGMNIDVKDKSGWTALMNASYIGQEQCVQFLLDHNAKVDLQSKSGMTALMLASQSGSTNIVGMLLEKNANPDLQSESGMTALMIASARGYKEIVQLLLNDNPDVELKSNDGNKALDPAGKVEIKELIQNHVNTSYVLK